MQWTETQESNVFFFFFKYGNSKNIKNRNNISQATTENKLNIVNLQMHAFIRTHGEKNTRTSTPR